MEKRLLEIQARKKEIRDLLTSGENLKLDEIQAELEELEKEERAIEKRMEIAGKINIGEIRGNQIKAPGTVEATETKTDSLEYRKAFMDFVLKGTPIPTELRADAVTKTTDIEAVIPENVMNKIVEKLEAAGMILPLVTQTAYKGGVSIPTSSVKPVATWVAEGAGSDKQKKGTGNITFAYHKLRCAVAVTLETDVMALSAFEAALIKGVTQAMIKAVEQAIISGSGAGSPKGILTETPADGQAITGATISYVVLTEAEGALPIEYENGAVWCMTKKTFMQFVGMVDDNGQPIARTNTGINGKPERTLLGRTVILCNYLDTYSATLTAGKTFAFLFDFSDYILNTNYSMTIKKYEDNETEDQVTKAVMLVDGKVVDVNSLVVLQK